MYTRVMIFFTICCAILGMVSAGILPLAAPLAATGVIAPYATSYNAHTVNHNIAAPYVAATPFAAPVVARYAAAAPAVVPAGLAAYSAAGLAPYPVLF
ncbi:uncharacterized protein LOC129727620 [Wyeomyia smithii]|uniref:uncharacterized protein LOC129727620 n=1 Tax=Wyeomyia smithii TaxID=174621 RepID=UPI002467B734|nr:uncharacterized protein LOC129727620 [Wyeomyia smithii]